MFPEVLAQFRSRLDEPPTWRNCWPSTPPPPEAGLVRPAHRVVATVPSEQGSQRVNAAATL